MKINYVLTAFSPQMFKGGATVHIREIPVEEARKLVDETSVIIATRDAHDLLARGQFPNAYRQSSRFAALVPGTNAIHLHYRGPMITDGTLPPGGQVSCYLIEVEEYQTPE